MLKLVLNTKVIPTQHVQYHYIPGVKRTIVRWQHYKNAECQRANNNNTEFESVGTLLNDISANVDVEIK